WPTNLERGWPTEHSPQFPAAAVYLERSAPHRGPQAGPQPRGPEATAQGSKSATCAQRWAGRRFWGAARLSTGDRAGPGSAPRAYRAWARFPSRRAVLASTVRAE